MATAAVGDDVKGEDPTVNELEALAAEMVGKEAGLFVSSGTMGNLVAILAHTTRGDEAIAGEDAHTIRSEAGGMASLAGVMPKPLPTDQFGQMDLETIKTAVSPHNPHYPITSLILVENSYGNKQGYPLPPDYFAQIKEIANLNKMSVHMDGARLFNAAIAQNIDVREITQHVDTVTFCLSKGLSAPAGSILSGSRAFIHKARRARKLLGGGMRQAGILAAAGLVSLTQMVDRLAEDHRRAKTLALELAKIPGILIQPEMVKTNIVFFDIDASVKQSKQEIIENLRTEANIHLDTGHGRQLRAVTHYWISDADITKMATCLNDIISQ